MKEDNLTFWEHLEELRAVLFKSIIAWVIAAIGVFCAKTRVFALLFAPSNQDFILFRCLRKISSLIGWESLNIELEPVKFLNTELTAQFMTHLQVALWGGLVVAMPFIIYWLYTFISPALYKTEKRYTLIALFSGIVLFAEGVMLNYFLIFPISFRFLSSYQVYNGIANQISLSSYIYVFLILCLLMGFLFEIPVLSWLLHRLGLLDAKTLKKYRRHTFVIILIVAAVITPTGDPFTLLLITLPVYLLYELSIYIIA